MKNVVVEDGLILGTKISSLNKTEFVYPIMSDAPTRGILHS